MSCNSKWSELFEKNKLHGKDIVQKRTHGPFALTRKNFAKLLSKVGSFMLTLIRSATSSTDAKSMDSKRISTSRRMYTDLGRHQLCIAEINPQRYFLLITGDIKIQAGFLL